MLFKWNGIEFNINKPVCVLGYTIKDTWFPLSVGQESFRVSTYPMSCKKMYVGSLDYFFNKDTGLNELYSMKLFPVDKKTRDIVCDYSRNKRIVGRSPKECVKLLRETEVEKCQNMK